MATTTKIEIQIDDKVIELKGAEKESFELDRKQMQDSYLQSQADIKARQNARQSAMKKLAELAELTQAELDSL